MARLGWVWWVRGIIHAQDTDTVVVNRGRVPTRCLRTDFTLGLLELEKANAPAEAIEAYIGYRSNYTSQIEGDLTGGEAYCGASAGLIKETLSAAEVVRLLIQGYSEIVGRM